MRPPRAALPKRRRVFSTLPCPALLMASVVRLGDDVLFEIIACGDEMMPAAVRSAYGGAYRGVRPHQHDCARDYFSTTRFDEKVLEGLDHLRFDPNRGSKWFATE